MPGPDAPNPGACALDTEHQATVRRLAAARVLSHMVSFFEKELSGTHEALYEYHLARGLAKALEELAEGGLHPFHLGQIDAALQQLARSLFDSADAVLEQAISQAMPA